MFTDEQLLEQLGRALDPPPREPPADRVAALRTQAEASATVPAPRRRTVAAWMAIAAAAVAFVCGALVAVSIGGDGGDDGIAGEVEYDGGMVGPGGEPVEAELSVVATGIGRVVELTTDALPILPTGEYYEVWFVGPGDGPATPNRISAGTFHPDQDGRTLVRFAAAVDPSLYPTVEVTAEVGDGDPGPAGPVVLRAELTP